MDKSISVASKLADSSGCTSLRRIPRGGIEHAQMEELHSFLDNTILSDMQDRWRWTLSKDGEFSVATLRGLIDDKTIASVGSKTRWNNFVPSKINILAWRIKHDFLPPLHASLGEFLGFCGIGSVQSWLCNQQVLLLDLSELVTSQVWWLSHSPCRIPISVTVSQFRLQFRSSDFVPPPDCGDGIVRFVLYDLTKPSFPSSSVPLDHVDVLGQNVHGGFTLTLLDHLLSKGLRTVKSIPPNLLVLPIWSPQNLLEPRSNLECKSASKRQHQEECIASGIHSWGTPGGSLQLLRETLAEPTPLLSDIDISDGDHDLSKRNMKQCKRKICDGHYTAAVRVQFFSRPVSKWRLILSSCASIDLGPENDGYGLSMLVGNFPTCLQFSLSEIMLQEVRIRCPAISHWVEFCYSNPARLYYGEHTLWSHQGVQQGDPLGPLLFALVLHPLICKIKDSFSLSLHGWYLDDGTIIGDTLVVGKVLELIIEDGPRRGLHLNVNKSSVDLVLAVSFCIERVLNHRALWRLWLSLNDPQCEFCYSSCLSGFLNFNFSMCTCSPQGPGFGDWQWRLATLPFAFGGLGVYCAGDVLSYAFLASRLQSASLQTKLLRHSGIVSSGLAFDSALNAFNACSRVFMGDIYGDHAMSCAGIVGIKHRHNVVRDTLVDILNDLGFLTGPPLVTQSGANIGSFEKSEDVTSVVEGSRGVSVGGSKASGYGANGYYNPYGYGYWPYGYYNPCGYYNSYGYYSGAPAPTSGVNARSIHTVSLPRLVVTILGSVIYAYFVL
ncbi:putative reverse transcriptase domain-containing protein [Tanacetum coccineum]